MLKKDYIMRLVEQFGRFLARILRLKENRDHPAALIAINELLTELLGLSSEYINSVSENHLIEMMKMGGTFDSDKCIMVAVLAKEEGEIYEAQGMAGEGARRYLRALNLFLEAFLINKNSQLSGYFNCISELADKLSSYPLPEKTRDRLLQYFGDMGLYSKAEDLLFRLLETDCKNKKLAEAGSTFYRKLLLKSDQELAGGNLPREEVLDGLARFEQIMKEE